MIAEQRCKKRGNRSAPMDLRSKILGVKSLMSTGRGLAVTDPS